MVFSPGKLAKRKSLKSDRRKSVAGQVSEGTDIPFEIARALKESEEDTDELPASEADVGHLDAVESNAEGAEPDEPLQEEALRSEETDGAEESQESTVIEADEHEFAGIPKDNTKIPSADNEYEDATPTTPTLKHPAGVHRTGVICVDNDPVCHHGAEPTMFAPSSEIDCGSPGSRSMVSRRNSGAEIQNDLDLETESLHGKNSGNVDQTPLEEALSAASLPVVDDQSSDLDIGVSSSESEMIDHQMPGSPTSTSPARNEASVDQSPVVETLAPSTSENASSRHQTAASPTKSQIVGATQPEAQSPTADQESNPSAGNTHQPNEPLALPQSRTRSGTRFSDDTTLLQDFLNRARAHKAAKATPQPPSQLNPLHCTSPLPPPRRSPRRSPRKALHELDRNSPSPTKPRDTTLQPGTPSKAHKHASLTASSTTTTNDANPTAPPSRRRSARTRLPTPAAPKTHPSAPRLIPLIRRGADGGDPVVLKKSEAQDLALATRANTRRNKAGAKLPALTLQSLQSPPVAPSPATTTRLPHPRPRPTAKSVAWDDQLTYFQPEPQPARERTKPANTKRKDATENDAMASADHTHASRPTPMRRRLKPPGRPLPGPGPGPGIAPPAPVPTPQLDVAFPAPDKAKKKIGLARGVGGGAGASGSAGVGAGVSANAAATGLRRRGRGR